MPTNVSIKNVPDEIMDRLRERAKRNHRSLQGELMSIFEEAAGKPGTLTFEQADRRIKSLGLKTHGDSTTLIREMRDAGYGR